MDDIKVMFSDLSSVLQQDILDAYGVKGPEDMNWDVVPIATIPAPEIPKEGMFEPPDIPDRGDWMVLWNQYIGALFDDYGYNKLPFGETDRGGFENEVFSVNPYYWGDDEDVADEPNLIYKPKGLKVWWYKYPFRGVCTNQKLSLKELEEIFRDCLKSISKNVADKEYELREAANQVDCCVIRMLSR